MMNKVLLSGALLALPFVTMAQKDNWHNMDLQRDSVFGISTEKAYAELLKNKSAKKVIVGVIDSGVDTLHEDLRAVLLLSSLEKPSNRKDEDKNGYTDDYLGWSFIGSAKGNVDKDNLELVRLVRRDRKRFAGKDSTELKGQALADFKAHQLREKELTSELEKAKQGYAGVMGFASVLDEVLKGIGKENPSAADLAAYRPRNNQEANVLRILAMALQSAPSVTAFREQELDKALEHFKTQLDFQLNVDYDPRSMVGDNYEKSSEKFYGNADVMGPDAMHGTHVAGIIAAERANNKGILGVCEQAVILPVRAVPDGDERDKDVANAIRYAVDRGAKVINMSFGKAYSSDKTAVDQAVQYAMKKDVLLVHAAGNDNKNLDERKNFPTRVYSTKGEAAAWLEVGASSFTNDLNLKAPFSNYGKNSVDVFAPGVQINSTVPGSGYRKLDGTSMAAPVVAGLAALIRSYYPQFSALQVKDIIIRSVVKIDHPVTLERGGEKVQVPFTDLCRTGGIVNTYRALELAAELAAKKTAASAVNTPDLRRSLN